MLYWAWLWLYNSIRFFMKTLWQNQYFLLPFRIKFKVLSREIKVSSHTPPASMFNRISRYRLCLLPIHQPQMKVTNNAWLLTDILCGFRLSRIIRFFIIRALYVTCTQTWAKQSIKARQWNPQTSLCASRQFSTLLRSGNCGRNGLQLKTVYNYFSFCSSDPQASSSASVSH